MLFRRTCKLLFCAASLAGCLFVGACQCSDKPPVGPIEDESSAHLTAPAAPAAAAPLHSPAA